MRLRLRGQAAKECGPCGRLSSSHPQRPGSLGVAQSMALPVSARMAYVVRTGEWCTLSVPWDSSAADRLAVVLHLSERCCNLQPRAGAGAAADDTHSYDSTHSYDTRSYDSDGADGPTASSQPAAHCRQMLTVRLSCSYDDDGGGGGDGVAMADGGHAQWLSSSPRVPVLPEDPAGSVLRRTQYAFGSTHTGAARGLRWLVHQSR
jgi:hypothetical protein